MTRKARSGDRRSQEEASWSSPIRHRLTKLILRSLEPLLCPIGVALTFPHRQVLLEAFDEMTAGGERGGAMAGGDVDRQRHVARHVVADAVDYLRTQIGIMERCGFGDEICEHALGHRPIALVMEGGHGAVWPVGHACTATVAHHAQERRARSVIRSKQCRGRVQCYWQGAIVNSGYMHGITRH